MSKLVVAKFPTDFGPDQPLDPNHSIVLGGMCLLMTIDMKRIYNKQITFESVNDFERWLSSWYPRIDQIHDTVGVPPGFCKKIIYVIEDSFFANRLSAYTGLDRNDIRLVLRRVHEQQGHQALTRYLRCFGYKGEVSVIYTSEIDTELTLALQIWERILGSSFRACDRDFAKVELMYTGFWLDVLGIKSSAIIYESTNKMILKGWLKLENWFREQSYGCGINRNLGIVGYLPFLAVRGDSSLLGFDEVPNYQNFRSYTISDDDMPWYIINLLFAKKVVAENGPSFLLKEKAADLIRSDLLQYYTSSTEQNAP